jgi:hypothetical protein
MTLHTFGEIQNLKSRAQPFDTNEKVRAFEARDA